MIIHKIALNGFRNYEWETADFSSSTNVITGENAQGKTNLLEAVYLLSSGKSFRTRYDRELVGFDFSEAEILAEVYSHEREQSIRIRMSPGQTKRITVNGVRKTATELSETVNTVLFCPDDLNLIKDGAAVRRKMMDQAISQIRPKYAALLTEFNRLYEHKTRILKDWREKPSLLDTLDSFSDALCRISAQMIRYRASYMSRLNDAVKPIHMDFSGKGEEIDLVNGDDDDETPNVSVAIYRLDMGVLEQALGVLSENHMTETRVDNTHVSGKISLSEEGRLITTIPYEEGWKVLVNGEVKETEKFGGAFLALELEPGDYEIEMEYTPKGKGLGIGISLLCLAVAGILFGKKSIRKIN